MPSKKDMKDLIDSDAKKTDEEQKKVDLKRMAFKFALTIACAALIYLLLFALFPPFLVTIFSFPLQIMSLIPIPFSIPVNLFVSFLSALVAVSIIGKIYSIWDNSWKKSGNSKTKAFAIAGLAIVGALVFAMILPFNLPVFAAAMTGLALGAFVGFLVMPFFVSRFKNSKIQSAILILPFVLGMGAFTLLFLNNLLPAAIFSLFSAIPFISIIPAAFIITAIVIGISCLIIGVLGPKLLKAYDSNNTPESKWVQKLVVIGLSLVICATLAYFVFPIAAVPAIVSAIIGGAIGLMIGVVIAPPVQKISAKIKESRRSNWGKFGDQSTSKKSPSAPIQPGTVASNSSTMFSPPPAATGSIPTTPSPATPSTTTPSPATPSPATPSPATPPATT